MKRIALRLIDGWTVPVNNTSNTNCDACGHFLHIAPHGALYCDHIHDNAITSYAPKRK